MLLAGGLTTVACLPAVTPPAALVPRWPPLRRSRSPLEAPHRLSAREGLLRSAGNPRGTVLLAGVVLPAALLA
ncbi:hypothetical protein FE391_10455 [Nonomuraea sp. KC401]|uniref:hypothetical protein n=1 Tax=unclassified Nonomuraea TaxID=2593643 RepID=UPI0010FDC028|nr:MULTISPECIES: hypothetical protein [unclassified Nonomuraea]NBE93260.1 hypothetical protein [Nonomuraea sp. K271]TLF78003.1 hypothetical protein FE391_10455 [Nonomuraea sp. KC401]